MKLILRNIGLLKDAELELESLSVIAGENDNGKSTVGKIMFCLIKAISRYKEDLQESKEFKVNEKFREVYFFLRHELNFKNYLIDSDSFEKQLQNIRLLQDSSEGVANRLSMFEAFIASFVEQNIDPSFTNTCKELYAKIKLLIQEPEDPKKSMENALKKVFAAEFDSKILLEGEKEGFIGLYEGEIRLIQIDIKDDNQVTLRSNVEPVAFKDATFIDTPLILNNYGLLIGSKTLLDMQQSQSRLSRLGSPYTTLHTKDLFDKLIEPSFADLFDDRSNKIFDDMLNNIFSGEVIYDPGKKDFVFHSNDDVVISIKNTASGIKVFGILQLLLKNDFINKDSLLIFDEPENHLHPKWQLKFAEILVRLSDKGISILISSHSPYMIEALKRYSDKVKVEPKPRFYLARNNKIENKDQLGEIFKILSEPFAIFRSMDRDELRDELRDE